MSAVPAISILTPVWNGLPYIKECVQSVMAQDFQDWEMIIGDNASEDGTSEYLRTLNDPRIKVFRHEKNLGVYKNIRFLYNTATAPIYTALCADDYFHEGGLRKIVAEWAKVGPEIGLITFNWKHRQMNHSRLTAHSYSVLPRVIDKTNAAIAYFLFGNLPGNFTEVSARVPLVVSEDFMYQIKFSGDFEYWLRLSKKTGIFLSNTDVVYIRRHDRVMATYAVAKGEYHEESIPVYEMLIDELSKQCDRRKLIAFYNITYISYHLRDAIKWALHGRFTSIKSFLRQKSPIFWPLQTIVCMPFALSERLRYMVAIRLANKLLAEAGVIKSKHAGKRIR
jgi:glycosyltransferase involved in cell wall biosynthesis